MGRIRCTWCQNGVMRNSRSFSSSGADVSTCQPDGQGRLYHMTVMWKSRGRTLSSTALTCQQRKNQDGADSAASGVVRRSCGTCAVPGPVEHGTVPPCQQRTRTGRLCCIGRFMRSCGTRVVTFLIETASTCQRIRDVSQEQGRVDSAASESPRFAAWIWIGYYTT